MITFFADNHYGTNIGRARYEQLPPELQALIDFHDISDGFMNTEQWAEECPLLLLDMIGGSCGVDYPGPQALEQVRLYLESGKNIVLFHGASAAFHREAWWRENVGLRWVRPEDPDGETPSFHPIEPVKVKCLASPPELELHDFQLPEDEIYLGLKAAPALQVFLAFERNGELSPCFAAYRNVFGGTMWSLLPGHAPETAQTKELKEITRWLCLYGQQRR